MSRVNIRLKVEAPSTYERLSRPDRSKTEPYLSTQRDLNGNRDDLSEETAVKRHHECNRVVVREHQRHL